MDLSQQIKQFSQINIIYRFAIIYLVLRLSGFVYPLPDNLVVFRLPLALVLALVFSYNNRDQPVEHREAGISRVSLEEVEQRIDKGKPMELILKLDEVLVVE